MIAITPDAISEPRRIREIRRRDLAMLFATVVFAAAVASKAERHPDNQRSGFMIGVSAIGGPDGIGNRDPNGLDAIRDWIRKAQDRL